MQTTPAIPGSEAHRLAQRANGRVSTVAHRGLAIGVYERLKKELFDFRLLPGDRFTETAVAVRLGVSRTPVREALYRLMREGYIEVSSRNGWNVAPFDFGVFEDLYDVRMVLEIAAARRLCESASAAELAAFGAAWRGEGRVCAGSPQAACAADEAFHRALVDYARNAEMARIHHEVSERIRLIRRLDLAHSARIETTHAEHAAIVKSLLERRRAQAERLLRAHIETSKAVVRQITLHRLHSAREIGARSG